MACSYRLALLTAYKQLAIASLSRRCTLLHLYLPGGSPLQFRLMLFTLHITLLGVPCRALDPTTDCLPYTLLGKLAEAAMTLEHLYSAGQEN